MPELLSPMKAFAADSNVLDLLDWAGGRLCGAPRQLGGGMATAPTSSIDQVLVALRTSEVLGRLSAEGAAALARAGSAVDLPAGRLLCQAGDPGDAVYVVLDGEIEVRTASRGGREVRFVALGKGALAGEMAVLDGGPRSADMAATRRSRLWRIPRAALLERLEAEPAAAVSLLVELVGRLRRTNAALEAQTTLDLGGRLARLLLAEQNARGLVALSQTELARRIGASREKVNRKLKEWSADGQVAVTTAGIRVLAPERLAGGGSAAS
ncbi:MAG: Crp/Fnr family transcriptional regulator [Phenylobacterium sp.]|nr:MAG: Crp/Fnr family transcriptional regulator [Phenylobacterium sp.]